MTCTSARSKVADHMDMHWCDRGTSFESQLQRIKGTSAEKELVLAEWVPETQSTKTIPQRQN